MANCYLFSLFVSMSQPTASVSTLFQYGRFTIDPSGNRISLGGGAPILTCRCQEAANHQVALVLEPWTGGSSRLLHRRSCGRLRPVQWGLRLLGACLDQHLASKARTPCGRPRRVNLLLRDRWLQSVSLQCRLLVSFEHFPVLPSVTARCLTPSIWQ